MFVILTYDVEEKKVNRVRKIIKKYLTWTQNSVFEGEVTEGKLHKCLTEVGKIIDKNVDSVYIYRVKVPQNINKDVIGVQKNFDSLFL